MMKKRIKLFSSALAVGMLLGTGVGSLSAVVQQGPGTTMVAKAEAETPDTQEGESVKLENSEMTVVNGIITGVNLSDERRGQLLNGGILTIPAKYSNTDSSEVDIPITGIGNEVFSKHHLEGGNNDEGIREVIFENPEGIEHIGEGAFYNNTLTSIDLPSVKTIGDSAFAYNKLTKVDMPNVEMIDNSAFRTNALTNIDLPNVKTIGDSAFEYNRLISVNVPNVEMLSDSVFNRNSLANIDLSNVKTIGNSALASNKLTSVDVPNVEMIGNSAFQENYIKIVSINKKHSYDETKPGTIQNPDIKSNAFGAQRWNEAVKFSYQPTISYRNLVEKLGLTFMVNGNDYLNEMRFKGSIQAELPHNIEYSDEDQKITVSSEDGGNLFIQLTLFDKSQENSSDYLSGVLGLVVNAKDGSTITNPPLPNPEDTNKPDPGNPDTGDNNGNESKPQPAPQPEERRPHTVYAKRAMRLHRNVSLTSPIRSYKKQSRAKAASFRVRGIEYDKNGKKRYKVDGGYITAGATYVADSHFRSNKVRQVRVLSNRINSYKDVKLSSNKKVRSYKKGTKLKVKRIVNHGRATRFELTNGRYITGNKQLLIMDQK